MGIDVASANWLAGFAPDIGRETLGDAAWERGFAYAAAGNVLSITSADRGRMLLAEVAGSRDWPHQTLVTATAPLPRACAACWTAGSIPDLALLVPGALGVQARRRAGRRGRRTRGWSEGERPRPGLGVGPRADARRAQGDRR